MVRKVKHSQRKKREIKNQDKIKRKSAIATTLIFISLLVTFMIAGWKTPLPLPEEKGIDVVIGSYESGKNEVFEEIEESSSEQQDNNPEEMLEEGQSEDMTEPASASSSESEISQDESLTQETEDAPVISETESTSEEKEALEKELEGQTEEDKEEKEEKPKRKVDPKTLFSKSEKSKGNTEQTGNQGEKDGNPDSESFEKVADSDENANGISFDLSGRGIAKYPNINDQSQKSGKVVVEITVNKNGEVINARAGVRGSTTYDKTLLRLAEKAAYDTKFTPNPGASSEQIGTITFDFKLR